MSTSPQQTAAQHCHLTVILKTAMCPCYHWCSRIRQQHSLMLQQLSHLMSKECLGMLFHEPQIWKSGLFPMKNNRQSGGPRQDEKRLYSSLIPVGKMVNTSEARLLGSRAPGSLNHSLNH